MAAQVGTSAEWQQYGGGVVGMGEVPAVVPAGYVCPAQVSRANWLGVRALRLLLAPRMICDTSVASAAHSRTCLQNV